MDDYIQVITAVPGKQEADKIASALLDRRLAGCVQVLGPVESSYWWQGKIEVAKEWLCLIKSRQGLFDQVDSVIREIHPYTVPEILAAPITAGSRKYLDWLGSELKVS